jgi:probable rRNA maturation factor
VDIVFCRDRDIIALNKKFKKINHPTDVLAFDLRENDNRMYLGEVYVNLQMARRQSRKQGVPYQEEVKRLAVHGVLHLLGYRDDRPAEHRRMWSLQESYIRNVKE